MRAEGLGDAAVESFARQYERLRGGESGTLAEADIEPVESLPRRRPERTPAVAEAARPGGGHQAQRRARHVDGDDQGQVAARGQGRAVVPGPRSPSRCWTCARSPARALPLILMNSFATREDSLAALERYDDLSAGLPRDFVQNKVPKLRADDLAPVEWQADPGWSGRRPATATCTPRWSARACWRRCSTSGYRYAFVSNSDNLGAVLDLDGSSAWFAQSGAPFLMEVADRTSSDRKGGHLARRRSDGGLVLREIAQTPDEDVDAFQDTSQAPVLQHQHAVGRPGGLGRGAGRRGAIDLPMIVNRKTVDPGDKVLDAGHPAGDRDGRGDRRLRGRGGAARAAVAVRAGQDDQRPAVAALRRLRDRRRAARCTWPTSATASRRSSTSTPTTTSWSPTSTRASRRRAVAGRLRLAARSRGDVTFGARRRRPGRRRRRGRRARRRRQRAGGLARRVGGGVGFLLVEQAVLALLRALGLRRARGRTGRRARRP